MTKKRSETKQQSPKEVAPEAMTNPLTGREITKADLESIKKLVDLQISLECEINMRSLELEKMNEKLRNLSTQLIPDAMKEIGLSEVTTTNGARVIVKPFYSAKIPEGWITRAFKWLRKNNHDGLIKNAVVCEFGKGADEEAIELKKLLKENNIPFEHKETVHPQTLKSWVKEQIEAGNPINYDMFGVYVGSVTKIEIPESK